MELAIAEKKEVAEAICKSLSNSFKQEKNYFYCQDLDLAVGWASGHLMKSADPEYFDEKSTQWNLDALPIDWPVKFIPDPKKIHLLKTLGELMKKASCVYNACDIDSAGAYIFNAILEYHSYKGSVKRVFITDNNLIKKAWDNAKEGNVDYLSAMSEKARTIADQRFGYNMTRALTLQGRKQGYDGVLNCGRVQVYFIGAVVARALEIGNFKKHKYYDLFVDLTPKDGVEISDVKLVANEKFKLDDKKRIIDRNELDSLNPHHLIVKKVEVTEKEVSRPFPYDLSSLQGECDRIFGLTLDEVLKITQSLREKGLCTYNRTDSRGLHDEAFDDAPKLLQELSNVDFLAPILSLATVDPDKKSKCFDSSLVTAHHGIIPCENTSNISELNETELTVYYLIARNYIIQFMPAHIKQYSTCILEDESGNVFKASYTKTLTKGWKILFEKEPQDESEGEENEAECDFDFSTLNEGDRLTISNHKIRELESKPRQYFTISSLLNAAKNPEVSNDNSEEQNIKAMLKHGNGGVGTSATRTPILTQLFDRGVLKKVGNKVRETEKAILLYNALPREITSPQMTAQWAMQQHNITTGSLSVDGFTHDVIQLTNQMVNKIKEGIEIPESMRKEAQGKVAPCPICKSEISLKKGKFGKYWPCRSCNNNFSDVHEQPFFEKCNECGKAMKAKPKQGKYFIYCSGYPECKSNKSI